MANEKTTYQGSCHCGAVRYMATTDLEQVISCNCSICSRTGSVLTFVPAGAFELLSGDKALTDYQFAKKSIHHLFCSHCGIRSFSKGTGPGGEEMVALNLRCLEGVDVDKLQVVPVDGKSF